MPDHDLSVQLYTVRNALAEDFDGTLERIAGYGFTQVEPFGFTNFLDGLRTLGQHGLSAPTTHMGLVVDADLDAIFAAAAELGIGTVIEPAVRAPQWQDADGIRATADALNAAATKAAEHGLRVGYHNHWWEIESSVDGRTGLEVLADHLAPEVVLEVDTYWAYAGGADVPALLERLGDRVVALHVKDGDGSTEPKNQVAVGSGSLPVWSFLEAAPDALRVIELDDSEGDMLDAVRDSHTYLTAGKGA
jgi:sugar phosphate isomerase/epimerase